MNRPASLARIGLTHIEHELATNDVVGGFAKSFAQIFGEQLLPEISSRFPKTKGDKHGSLPNAVRSPATAECRQANE